MGFIVPCHLEAMPASGIVALSITADCLTVVALFVSAVLCLHERWKKIGKQMECCEEQKGEGCPDDSWALVDLRHHAFSRRQLECIRQISSFLEGNTVLCFCRWISGFITELIYTWPSGGKGQRNLSHTRTFVQKKQWEKIRHVVTKPFFLVICVKEQIQVSRTFSKHYASKIL